jgi:hypothetical protein
MPTVLMSDAIGAERLGPDTVPLATTAARRHWYDLARLYAASLAACGLHVEHVLRPEIYQTATARRIRNIAGDSWHLAVKPIEHNRPFHGIPNVFVCDWPFPEVSATAHGGSPFHNHVRLLGQAEVVACCTEFTAGCLRRAGVGRVIVLPPHIPHPLAGGTAHSPAGNAGRDRRVFVTEVDLDRLPGQISPIVTGFTMARAHCRDICLIVRVRGSEPADALELRRSVLRALRLPEREDAVSFEFDDQAEVGSDGLLNRAAFFLWGSAADGLPLALIRAMLAEVPLVTTLHSGTESILPAGSSVAIATTSAAAEDSDTAIARFMHLTCQPPAAEAVRDAILAALDLDDASLTAMTSTCRAVAEERFGLAAFQAGLARLEEHLRVRQ